MRSLLVLMAVVAVMNSAFVALSYVGVGLGAGVGKLSFLIGVFQRKRPSLDPRDIRKCRLWVLAV